MLLRNLKFITNPSKHSLEFRYETNESKLTWIIHQLTNSLLHYISFIHFQNSTKNQATKIKTFIIIIKLKDLVWIWKRRLKEEGVGTAVAGREILKLFQILQTATTRQQVWRFSQILDICHTHDVWCLLDQC